MRDIGFCKLFKCLKRDKYDPNAFIVINEGVTIDGNFLKKL